MGVKKASKIRKKPLKILLFGDAGVGKTHLALQATPGETLVFDAESGTDMFEGQKGFEFDYWVDDDGMKTASIRELNKAIDYLATLEGRKAYKTFIVDPISDIWDNIQAQRLAYKEAKKVADAKKNNRAINLDDRNETDIDNFNQRDWGDMKRVYKNMMLRLKNLPQNVILIAREREILETKPNGDIVRTGEYTYEAEKGTKYAIDFSIRLVYDEKKKSRTAYINKSRNIGLAKGEAIQNPTFAMFNKVVNSMDGGEEVDGISEKDENIFIEENANVEEETANVKDVVDEIITICNEKIKEGVASNVLYDKIKEISGNKNPNRIKDIDVAEQVLEAINDIGVEEDNE